MEEAAESTAEVVETVTMPMALAPRVIQVPLVIVWRGHLHPPHRNFFVLHPSRRTGPLKAKAAANTNPSFYFFDTLNLVNKTVRTSLDTKFY
jgi:hypothetical protein